MCIFLYIALTHLRNELSTYFSFASWHLISNTFIWGHAKTQYLNHNRYHKNKHKLTASWIRGPFTWTGFEQFIQKLTCEKKIWFFRVKKYQNNTVCIWVHILHIKHQIKWSLYVKLAQYSVYNMDAVDINARL